MITKKNCPICQSQCDAQQNYDKMTVFYECPTCGRYELSSRYCNEAMNDNHIASYLFYHRFMIDSTSDYRYHTTMSREQIVRYKEEREKEGTTVSPVHMSKEIIENWYPKLFSDRIDTILLQISALTEHVGKSISLSREEEFSLLFVDRMESKNYKEQRRDGIELQIEASYMLNYLSDCQYIKYDFPLDGNGGVIITLQPKGYSRVDELQKNKSTGKNALVAMKFGDDTIPLREAIREGASKAGYNAVFIDEVQHNDFITPELLKYIRDSKFVIADLTHQNNGAYFEEGYAMGLGKPVIQLCKEGTKLHFDIAQKNTIMWKNEEEIPQRLSDRIKATIE